MGSATHANVGDCASWCVVVARGLYVVGRGRSATGCRGDKSKGNDQGVGRESAHVPSVESITHV